MADIKSDTAYIVHGAATIYAFNMEMTEEADEFDVSDGETDPNAKEFMTGRVARQCTGDALVQDTTATPVVGSTGLFEFHIKDGSTDKAITFTDAVLTGKRVRADSRSGEPAMMSLTYRLNGAPTETQLS